MIVQSKAPNTIAVVGLAPRDFPSTLAPGKANLSFGYANSTGNISNGSELLPSAPFGKGDVVGIGYEKPSSSVYVTKNGQIVAKFQDDLAFQATFFPTMSCSGPCSLQANFGNEPFKFQQQEKQ